MIGYSKLVISPFAILPHTRNKVNVEMILLDTNSGQLSHKKAAILEI